MAQASLLRRSMRAADARGRFDGIMIAADHLKRIAAWSRELNEREIEIARAGIVEKSYRANEFIFMRGDDFEYWTGVVTGLARMGIVSRGGKAASFAGLTAGAWFGEGTVLKNEPRRYDVVALRDTASGDDGPQHLLLAVREQRRVQPFPGRAAQRASRPVYRAARTWPHAGCDRAPRALDRLAVQSHSLSGPHAHLEITQEEIGALSGISRQNANQCLKRLEKEGLLRLEYGGVTIVDLERLRHYGE